MGIIILKSLRKIVHRVRFKRPFKVTPLSTQVTGRRNRCLCRVTHSPRSLEVKFSSRGNNIPVFLGQALTFAFLLSFSIVCLYLRDVGMMVASPRIGFRFLKAAQARVCYVSWSKTVTCHLRQLGE